jgi:hypothetical protein
MNMKKKAPNSWTKKAEEDVNRRYNSLPEVYHHPEKRLIAHDYAAYGIFKKRKTKNGLKYINRKERESGEFNVILENKGRYQKWFKEDLIDAVGKDKFKLLKETFTSWADGKKKRESDPVSHLKNSIHEHLSYNNRKVYVKKPPPKIQGRIFTFEDIEALVRINQRILDVFVDDWIEALDDTLVTAKGDLYVHRGMYKINPYALATEEYSERNHLTSYSLSLQVAEYFAHIKPDESFQRAIISSPLEIFRGRAVFVSFFWKGVRADQFEVLVIPSNGKIACMKNKKFFGVHYFTLGDG